MQVKESVNFTTEENSREIPKEDSRADATSSSSERKESCKSEIPRNDSFFSKFVNPFRSLSSSASFLLDKVKGTKIIDIAKQGYDIAKEELTTSSSKKARARAKAKTKYPEASNAPRSSSTAMIPVVQKRSAWEKRWDFFKGKVGFNVFLFSI